MAFANSILHNNGSHCYKATTIGWHSLAQYDKGVPPFLFHSSPDLGNYNS